MQVRTIGDRTVSAIGLGEMPLSIEGRPDEAQAMATIHASLDAGVTIIDTADAYALNTDEHGHGERIVAAAASPMAADRSRPGRHQGWAPPAGRRQLDRPRRPGLCEASLRGLVAGPRRRGHRAVPVPPARSQGALGRVGRRAGRPARRGQDPDGRRLQRHRGPDRRSPAGPGRPSGQRAERVLAPLPLLGERARALREDRAWPSSRGARWVASAAPTAWSASSRPSPRWPKRSAPRPSRSPWPGCWPRAAGSSRFPAAAGPRRPPRRPPQPTWL